MFLHVKGEGLNVGCNLTWGPCYDFQRQFFEADAAQAQRAVHRAQVRRRGQRLRLAGAGPRLPAEPARPDLPRLGRHQDQGLADLDDAADALGQGPGRRHRLRPLGQRPERRRQQATPRQRLVDALDTDKDGKRLRGRGGRRGCCPKPFATIDANGDGVITDGGADRRASSARREQAAEPRDPAR